MELYIALEYFFSCIIMKAKTTTFIIWNYFDSPEIEF